jgi:activator of HSP90 ATPase
VAITLGKNCSIIVNGAIGSARNVTFTGNARTIDVEEYGSRLNAVYSTGYDLSVSFEFNDSADLSFTQLLQGTTVTVSGGSAGWSFVGVVTSISETDPIDGVATFNVECRLSREGLRS